MTKGSSTNDKQVTMIEQLFVRQQQVETQRKLVVTKNSNQKKQLIISVKFW